MIEIVKVSKEHKEYFAKWWRDDYLISLTSGDYKKLSDEQVDKYFKSIVNNKNRYDFMICFDDSTIGHICLVKDKNNEYEMQTIIGELEFLGKGFGKQAINKLLEFAEQKNIHKIYLLVRPDNLRAINAYKASGFIKHGSIIETNNPNQPELIKMNHSSY